MPATKRLQVDHPPVRIRLGRVSVFSNPDADVLKIDVEGHDLHKLHVMLAGLPHTDTHPVYKPHVTISYLKPGAGQRYAGICALTGEEAVLDELTFSDKHGNETVLELVGDVNSQPVKSLNGFAHKSVDQWAKVSDGPRGGHRWRGPNGQISYHEPAATTHAHATATAQQLSPPANASEQSQSLHIEEMKCDGCASKNGDPEVVQKITHALSSMYGKAPGAKEVLAKHPIRSLTYHASKYVDRRPGVTGIWNDGKIAVGTKHPPEQEFPKFGGWGVDDSVAGYLRHEVGHHLYSKLSDDEKQEWATGWESKLWSQAVGRYAGTNPEEGFAEAFCAMSHPRYQSGLPEQAQLFLTKRYGANNAS